MCWRNGVIYSHKKSINTSFLDWITFLVNSCNMMLKFSVDTSCFHNKLIFNVLLVKCICLFNDPNWGRKVDLKVWWGYWDDRSVPTWTKQKFFSILWFPKYNKYKEILLIFHNFNTLTHFDSSVLMNFVHSGWTLFIVDELCSIFTKQCFFIMNFVQKKLKKIQKIFGFCSNFS